MKCFKIGQGNTPNLVDTLCDGTGAPVNVAGATVAFILQGEGGVGFTRTGAVADGPNGKVNYQFIAADSAAPGDYLAQWRITLGAVTTTYPVEGYIKFTVLPGLPFVAAPAQARLSDYFDDIRAICGDHQKRRYEDSAIARVMKVVLKGGRVPITGSTALPPDNLYQMGADNRSITPAIPNADATAYLLLVYHTAKLLLLPNVKSSSYRTRAVSERFGDQKDFLAELEEVLFQLENGVQCYTEVRGLRAWVFSLSGLVQNSALLIPGDIMPSTIFL